MKMTYRQLLGCYNSKVKRVEELQKECREARETLLKHLLEEKGLNKDVLWKGERGRLSVRHPLSLNCGELWFYKYTKSGLLSKNKSTTVFVWFTETEEQLNEKLKEFEKAE